jgi:Lipocalin-like domain
MIKKIWLFVLSSSLIFFACKKEPQGKDLFYGKWKGLKWVVEGQPKEGMDFSTIKFEFDKKGNTYIANFAMMSEEGTFNLDNNCFNAHSVYGVNKKCPILKLSQDTMIWMMDSVQQPGNLYLVRVKE